MFRNYMTATLRNVARNRLYFYTNVVGLAVAITATLCMAGRFSISLLTVGVHTALVAGQQPVSTLRYE